jgi:hypothetical protein
VYPSL